MRRIALNGILTVLGVLGTGALVATVAPAAAEELVAYEVVEDVGIPESLTGQPGDPVRGKEVAVDRRLGNCLSCHVMPIAEQPFHGEFGPTLLGVGDRLTPAQMRLQVVDSKAINPESVMPAFYRVQGLHEVAKDFQGKPILTAGQVEDVVAYLTTLKE